MYLGIGVWYFLDLSYGMLLAIFWFLGVFVLFLFVLLEFGFWVVRVVLSLVLRFVYWVVSLPGWFVACVST